MIKPSGLLFGDDWDIIKQSVDLCFKLHAETPFITMAEIGVHEGQTSIALLGYILNKKSNKAFQYFGIDPMLQLPRKDTIEFSPHPALRFVKHYSHLAVTSFSVLHWVFVDGCHCRNCVVRDGTLYSQKLVKNGLIGFHDYNEAAQRTDPQLFPFMSAYHDEIVASAGIACREGLAILDLPSRGFVEVLRTSTPGKGGTIFYKKL